MKQFILNLRLFSLIALTWLKRNFQVVFVILAVFLTLIFIELKFNFLNNFSNNFSEGQVGTFQEHDLPVEFLRLVSSPLIDFDLSGKLVPKAAKSFEVNHDATTFKFHLKDNLVWSDGTKLKASDLEFPISNTEVNFPDEKTIEFKLKEPYSPFPSLLTRPLLKKGTLVGLGPYRITKIEKSRIFITKVNLVPLNFSLPDMVVRFYPNEKTALLGFELGEVQALLGIPASSSLQSKLVKVSQYTDYSKIVAIFYNTTDPLVGNRSLRQALSYQAPIVEGEEEAKGPIHPFSWAFNKEAKDYGSNTKSANEALERAKSANSDLLEKELVLTTTPQLENAGKKVLASWRELGLNATLRVESGCRKNFQALMITQSIPFDPDQYSLWHSTQTQTNLSKYSNDCCPTSARVDKNLEDGRRLTSEEDRKQRYFDFQRVLLEDSPATFLYFPKYNVVYLKKAEDRLNKVLNIQLNAYLRK